MTFWAKPGLEHQIDNQTTAGTEGIEGQRYAIFPIHASDAYGNGHSSAGVSVGTNGISVYENSSGYFPALLVYETNITDWVNVAVVYNNKTPSLFIDGVLVKTGLSSFKTVHPSAGYGDIYSNQSGGFGGGRDGSNYNHFGGWLDEIRYYDRALTSEEIMEGMNTVLDHENEDGLIGYWRFDEGQGSSTMDLSQNRNDAIIIGPNWSPDIPDQIPPETPQEVSVVAGDHEVFIDWSTSTEQDLAGYKVYRRIGTGTFELLATLSENESEYLDLTAENGLTYLYQVSAFDLSLNESDLSLPLEAIPQNVPPAIISSLTLQPGDGEIVLSWLPNSEWDITGYKVYFGISDDIVNGLNDTTITINHPDTQLVLSGLTNGTTYYVSISAIDQTNLESLASTILSETPVDVAPNSPRDFAGTGQEDQIVLNWSPNSEWDLTGYNIYRSISSGFLPSNETLIANADKLDSTFIDQNIQTGILYFYQISAVDASGNESSLSEEIAIFPSANRYSISFDASTGNYQYGTINIGNYTLMDSLGIELWINSTSNNDPIIHRRDGSNNDDAFWSMEIYNGRLRFFGQTSDELTFDLISGSQVNLGWVHCAVDIKSDSIKLYVNGNLEGESIRPSGDLPYKRFIWLGSRGNNIAPDFLDQFEGKIYDLRLWSNVPQRPVSNNWRWLTVPSLRTNQLAALFEFSSGRWKLSI